MDSEKKTCKTPGERIRSLREKCGLTQMELARKLMITREHLSKLEAGTRKLQVDDLPVLADVLGSSVDYILTGRECENIRLSREIGLDNEVIEKLVETSVIANMFDHDLPSGDDGIMKAVLSRRAREKLDAINFLLSADLDFELARRIYAFSRMDFSSGKQGLYRTGENGEIEININRTDENITELMFFGPDGNSSGITLPVSAMKNALLEEIKKKIEKL